MVFRVTIFVLLVWLIVYSRPRVGMILTGEQKQTQDSILDSAGQRCNFSVRPLRSELALSEVEGCLCGKEFDA